MAGSEEQNLVLQLEAPLLAGVVDVVVMQQGGHLMS